MYTNYFFLSNLGYAKANRGIPLAPPMVTELPHARSCHGRDRSSPEPEMDLVSQPRRLTAAVPSVPVADEVKFRYAPALMTGPPRLGDVLTSLVIGISLRAKQLQQSITSIRYLRSRSASHIHNWSTGRKSLQRNHQLSLQICKSNVLTKFVH
jgi:hypothetical protein